MSDSLISKEMLNSRSVNLYFGILDESGVLLDLRADIRGQLLGRAADRLYGVVGEHAAQIRLLERAHDFRVEFGHDIARRSRGREYRIPHARIVARHAGFSDRRQIQPG